MSLKSKMHPRNLYRNRPDFKELALRYPEFRQFAKQKLCGKIELDFKDPAAVRALTTVLLKKDFNLNIELPPDRLVPTLPLRLNYLLWIEDLLALLPNIPERVCGVDVGTGACCIYPIMGYRKNKWHFIATEADDVNYECSLKTIENNNLTNYIKLKKVNPDAMLLGQLDLGGLYNFSMCNPPFFDSDNPETKSRTDKRHPSRCPQKGGSCSLSEVAFKGGEVQFIKKLIHESKELKADIQIFTTMVGHKSSIGSILKMIQEAGATSWTRTEFCQGKTMRWGIAWTFMSEIPLNRYSFPTASDKAKIKPPLVYTVERHRWINRGDYSVNIVMGHVIEQLTLLKMEIKKIEEACNMSVVEFLAKENTWTHQRRRRRQEQVSGDERSNTEQTEPDQPEAKKIKVDVSVKEDNGHGPSNFHLKGYLRVRETDEKLILLQLEWVEGGLGRESINQIMQYLRNCLFDK